MADSPITQTHVIPAATGSVETDIMLPSYSYTTPPEPQRVGIYSQYEFTTQEQANSIISALATATPPKMWITSTEGETLSLSTYHGADRAMALSEWSGVADPSGSASFTADQNFGMSQILSTFNSFQDGLVAATTDPTPYERKMSGFWWSVPCRSVKTVEIPLAQGVPKEISITGQPIIRIYTDTGGSGDHVFPKGTLFVTWGFINFNGFVEREEQIPDSTGRGVSWKKVFTVAGKVIKAVAKVAEVVIPIAISFLEPEEQSQVEKPKVQLCSIRYDESFVHSKVDGLQACKSAIDRVRSNSSRYGTFPANSRRRAGTKAKAAGKQKPGKTKRAKPYQSKERKFAKVT